MIRWISATAIAAALIFGFVSPAEGDTIMLKSGVKLNGKIVSQDDETIRIRIGDREQTYPVARVAKVEENDHTGKLDKDELIARAEKRAAELLRETGLTAAQRREVKELMHSLQSTDSDVHDDAKRSLLKFHESAPLNKYFAWWLPGLSPRFVPGVLEILGVIDPHRAAQLALSHVTDLDPPSRAMALTILAKEDTPKNREILARGMVDPSPEARLAAARALGELKAKEATPLLIENLDSPHPRLKSVAHHALRTMWSGDSHPADLESKSDWQTFWDHEKRGVANPLIQVAMLPLVDPNEQYEDE